MSNQIVRPRNIDCTVPYADGDPEKNSIVETIRKSKIEVMKYDIEISKVKDVQKPFKEDLKKAEKQLAAGKSQLVACEEHIDFDANTVKTQRLDTKEWLPDREVNDKDRNPEAFDEEPEDENEEQEESNDVS